MKKIIRYAICNFDKGEGKILDDDGSLRWMHGTLEEAKREVEKTPTKCALFLPADVPGLGHPINRITTRDVFEKKPAVFGVCYYKAWRGFTFE